jgi:protein-tyrosine phosphatase
MAGSSCPLACFDSPVGRPSNRSHRVSWSSTVISTSLPIPRFVSSCRWISLPFPSLPPSLLAPRSLPSPRPSPSHASLALNCMNAGPMCWTWYGASHVCRRLHRARLSRVVVLRQAHVDIVKEVPRCLAFIKAGVQAGTNVLVHCVYGQSRSATIVIGATLSTHMFLRGCYDDDAVSCCQRSSSSSGSAVSRPRWSWCAVVGRA